MGDDGLEHLTGLTSLTQLNLDSRLIGDTGLLRIATLTNLVHLDLFGAKISDIGCTVLRQAPVSSSGRPGCSVGFS